MDLNLLEEAIKSAEEEIQMSLASVDESLSTLALDLDGQTLSGGKPVASSIEAQQVIFAAMRERLQELCSRSMHLHSYAQAKTTEVDCA